MKNYILILTILFSTILLSNAQNTFPPVISNDKMNVFYVGVDNPVTIGSPADYSKTTVSITNGTISGIGANRVVRVNNVGQVANITITADGKPTTYQFRCKRIPDPVFKVGSGRNPVSVTEFKNSSFCRVELENFDFDVRYTVVGATVKFSGTGFPNLISAELKGNNLSGLSNYMSRCGPGSSVTFTDIKVQGPDGIRTIESKTYLLN